MGDGLFHGHAAAIIPSGMPKAKGAREGSLAIGLCGASYFFITDCV